MSKIKRVELTPLFVPFRQDTMAALNNQPLGIASAMHIHVAAVRYHSLGHAIELFGHLMMEDDLIKERINYSNGTATVPTGPGWGVELDEEALKKYATAETAVIE